MSDDTRDMIVDAEMGEENDIRAIVARLLERIEVLEKRERTTNEALDFRAVDDYGNVIMVMSAVSLLNEMGVDAHVLGRDTDGTPQVWINAQNGSLGLAAGAYLLGKLGVRIYGSDFIELHESTVGAYTRYFRRGFQEVGGKPQYRNELYEATSSSVSIPNGDFSSLNMSNWTSTQKGLVLAALGALDPTVGSIAPSCIVIDGSGNVYVGGSGLPTSYVWKWDGSSWTAVGTLSTSASASGIHSLVMDGSGNLYVGLHQGTTSAVWKWNGSTWAALGTLAAGQSCYGLVFDGSGNLYAALQGASTSCVWKYASSTWSAVGTLTPTALPYCIAKDASNNIYVGGYFASGSYVRKWNGASWSTIGTLTTNTVLSLVVDGSGNIYVAVAGNGVYRWNGASWAAYGTNLGSVYQVGLDGSSNLYACALNDSDGRSLYKYVTSDWVALGEPGGTVYSFNFDGTGNIYVGGISYYPFATSMVMKYTITDWDGSSGKAVINSVCGIIPIFTSTARYALTALTKYSIGADAGGSCTDGDVTIKVQVSFYTASSGGSPLSTETVLIRTGPTLAVTTGQAVITTPAGTAYAEFITTVSGTKGDLAATFDNFFVGTPANLAYIRFGDDGVFAGDESVERDLLAYTGALGWLPFAYPLGYTVNNALTTSQTLAANGGACAIPIWLSAPMQLESVTIRNNDLASARTFNWYLYRQDNNSGLSSQNTLTRVASGTQTSFTPAAAASNRTSTNAAAPTQLSDGLYWLVVQNQHASNTLALGSQAADVLAANVAQTKTIGNPAGATLDFVAATWNKITNVPGVRLNGRVFGETAAF